MTSISRIARGKANFEAGKFLFNSETQDYINSLEKPKKKDKKKNE